MRMLWAALVLLVPGAAAAQGGCANAYTQADINKCARLAWESADADLNAAYQAAIGAAQGIDWRGEGRPEALLREAQRAWVAFRDAACDAEADPFRPGTIEAAIYWGCMERLTRVRTDDLRSYAANQGG